MGKIRDGECDHEVCDFIESHVLGTFQLPGMSARETTKLFEREAVYLFDSWSKTVPVVMKYLRTQVDFPDGYVYRGDGNDAVARPPVCVSRADVRNADGRKHASDKTQCGFPNLVGFCVGCVVMLLQNVIVGLKLNTGAIGTVVHVEYPTAAGPREGGNLGDAKPILIVDFGVELPLQYRFFRSRPTWVPVTAMTQFCDTRCCSKSQVPLLVAKALSFHKAQGKFVSAPSGSKAPRCSRCALLCGRAQASQWGRARTGVA